MAHILIADDDEIIAELAADMLIAEGHACGWVTDAEKALDLISWRRPDLLLLDQDMPGMCGGTLLRMLRTSEEFYDLPVIMFTAITGSEDERLAIFAGAQDYIRKPFDQHALLWPIEQLLSKRANRARHLDLRTVLEQSTGQWRDPSEQATRVI